MDVSDKELKKQIDSDLGIEPKNHQTESKKDSFFENVLKTVFGIGKKVSKEAKEVAIEAKEIIDENINKYSEILDSKLDEITNNAKELNLELYFVSNFNEEYFRIALAKRNLIFSFKDSLVKGSFLLGETYKDETWISKYEYFKIIKRELKSGDIEYRLKIDNIDTQDLYLEYPIDVEFLYNIITNNTNKIKNGIDKV